MYPIGLEKLKELWMASSACCCHLKLSKLPAKLWSYVRVFVKDFVRCFQFVVTQEEGAHKEMGTVPMLIKNEVEKEEGMGEANRPQGSRREVRVRMSRRKRWLRLKGLKV